MRTASCLFLALTSFSFSLIVLVVAGCSRGPSVVKLSSAALHEPDLTAAFYELTDTENPGFSLAPRLVFFGDGRFTCRRDLDAQGRITAPSFWVGELTIEERIELSTRERAVLAEAADADLSEPVEWESPPCPVTLFVLMRGASDIVIADFDFPIGEPLGRIARKAYVPFSAARLGYREFLLSLASTSRDLTPCPADLVAKLHARSAATIESSFANRAGMVAISLCGCPSFFPRRKLSPPAAPARIAVNLPLAPPAAFLPSLPAPRAVPF